MVEQVELLGCEHDDVAADRTSRADGSMPRPSKRSAAPSSACGRRHCSCAATGCGRGPRVHGGERLHDVVVGTEFEPDHTVDLLGAGGEQHDRHVALLADRPQDGETVDAREHHVEHDEGRDVGGQPGERLVAGWPGARSDRRVPDTETTSRTIGSSSTTRTGPAPDVLMVRSYDRTRATTLAGARSFEIVEIFVVVL